MIQDSPGPDQAGTKGGNIPLIEIHNFKIVTYVKKIKRNKNPKLTQRHQGYLRIDPKLTEKYSKQDSCCYNKRGG